MTRLATLLTALVLSTSCATYRGSRNTMIAGAVVTAAGAGLIVYANRCESCDQLSAVPAAFMFVALPGAVIFLSGLIGMGLHANDPPPSKATAGSAASAN